MPQTLASELHLGRVQAGSRGSASIVDTLRKVSDQEIVDDPHQRIADLLEILDTDMVAVVA
jgi:hypothetical protein